MSTRAKVIPLPPRARTLAAAPDEPAPASPAAGAWNEILFVGFLLLVNLVPFGGLLLGMRRWSEGELGLAAACALLAGREMALQIRDLARARRSRRVAR